MKKKKWSKTRGLHKYINPKVAWSVQLIILTHSKQFVNKYSKQYVSLAECVQVSEPCSNIILSKQVTWQSWQLKLIFMEICTLWCQHMTPLCKQTCWDICCRFPEFPPNMPMPPRPSKPPNPEPREVGLGWDCGGALEDGVLLVVDWKK